MQKVLGKIEPNFPEFELQFEYGLGQKFRSIEPTQNRITGLYYFRTSCQEMK